MSFWAGFANQLPTSQENNRRRRVEVLEAFNEFKRLNPYATANEFNSFIDQAAGGSYYLRGGMPGQKIIDEIAARNKAAYDQKLFTDYTQNIQDMAKAEGTFAGQVDTALMSLSPDASEADYKTAADNFIANLPKGQGPGYEDLTARIRTAFNPTRRGDIVRTQIANNMDNVMSLIKNSRGDEDLTADIIANRFGVPKDVGEALLARGKELYGQEQTEYRATRFDAAIAQGMRLLEAEGGMDLDPKALAAQIKEYFPGIDVSFAEDYFEKVAAEAIRKRNVAIDDRNRTIRNEAFQTANTIGQNFMGNKRIAGIVWSGNKAEFQQQYIKQLEQQLTDEQINLYFGVDDGKIPASSPIIEQLFNEINENNLIAQRQGQQTRREAELAKQTESVTKYTTDNYTRADGVFGAVGPIGKTVGDTLERDFDMNSVFSQLAAEKTYQILQAAKEAGDPAPSPAQIVAAIRADKEIMDQTQPLSMAANAYGERVTQSNVFNIETFAQYNTGLNEEVITKGQELNDYIQSIQNSSLPLEAKKAALAAAAERNKQFAVDVLVQHQQRKNKQDRWITSGTGGWNDEVANTAAAAVETNRDNIAATIEALQIQIDAEIAQRDAGGGNTGNPTTTNNTSTFNSVHQTVRKLNADTKAAGGDPVQANLTALDQFKRVLRGNVYNRKGRVKPGMEAVDHQYQMLEKYLDDVVVDKFGPVNVTVADKLAADPAEFDKFMNDPLNYMMSDDDFTGKYPGFKDLID